MPNKQNQRGRSTGDGRHVRFYEYELTCPAFRALLPNEIAVYLAMKRRYNGRNNGRIFFSTREAGDACRASNNTGARALNRLIELQFIKVKKNSTFGQKRLAREFELTAFSTKPAKSNEFLAGKRDFMKLTERDIRKLDAEKEMNKKKHSVTDEPHSPMSENSRL